MKKVLYLVMAFMLIFVGCKDEKSQEIDYQEITEEIEVEEKEVEEVDTTTYINGTTYEIEGKSVLFQGGAWFENRDDILVEVKLVDGEWIEVDAEIND